MTTSVSEGNSLRYFLSETQLRPYYVSRSISTAPCPWNVYLYDHIENADKPSPQGAWQSLSTLVDIARECLSVLSQLIFVILASSRSSTGKGRIGGSGSMVFTALCVLQPFWEMFSAKQGLWFTCMLYSPIAFYI